MVRSAAAILAVLILPGFAQGQEPVGTHTVVDDDTLWDLAQNYYQNPFEWRVIWNANLDVVEDPNLIYPAEVLVIPGLPGTVVATTDPTGDPVDPAGDPAGDPEPDPEPVDPEPDPEVVAPELVQFGFRQARPAEQVRTIFFPDTAAPSGVISAGEMQYVPVTRDQVYSAPWLIGLAGDPLSSGYVEGFATLGDRASTIRSFDRVRVSMPSPARVGELLQIFRVVRTIDMVGQVVVPTGILTVANIADGGVVGIVNKEYARIQPGDLVRPVPTYDLERGQYAQEIAGGSEAMIMGFSGRQVLNDVGHIAFLDLGSDDGITIGDEFILYGSAIGSNEGSLQVIGVTENIASARIVSMADNVFQQGVVVRLAKKMQ